jgi:hypothetical protein
VLRVHPEEADREVRRKPAADSDQGARYAKEGAEGTHTQNVHHPGEPDG